MRLRNRNKIQTAARFKNYFYNFLYEIVRIQMNLKNKFLFTALLFISTRSKANDLANRKALYQSWARVEH